MTRARLIFFINAILIGSFALAADERFDGGHFAGRGDVGYIELLDISRRMFEPDPEFLNVSMLYEPTWNGLVEGPTWNMWWIQNSYGTTYAWLPFATEPFTTFIQNSQDLWWNVQGDGKRADNFGYVAPDGCLVDAASPKAHYYRQGDANHAIHDWFMEATAAGVVMQAELLLISRDAAAIEKYLPKLERAANFIETRRDPATGLYQGGVACNLLAPSFGGYLKPDGTRGMAFHAGLQISYIAALDRLIELEKLAGRSNAAAGYEKRRDLAKQSLAKLITDEGYFLNSIDPDGTKHGVYGAPKHGYFESSANHDAIAFRIADDKLAKSIYTKIASLPQLRPHAFIIPNFPSYDDMYEKPQGLWAYGQWVNGGHWSTCEARMILAYYRLGRHADAVASMRQLMKFARRYRMDNPLTDFGNAVYQPKQPINITYDAFGPPAAFVRGLFEYLYKADRLVLIPHVPLTVTALVQRDPIRFGTKKLFLSTTGAGHVTSVKINGEVWTDHTADEITLPYETTPDEAKIEITLGYDAKAFELKPIATKEPVDSPPPPQWKEKVERLKPFLKRDDYAGAHARLTQQAIEVLPEQRVGWTPPESRIARDNLYRDTANKLFAGFEKISTSSTSPAPP